MKKYNFFISEENGNEYANFSEDYNKIHVNDIAGYNSIYGEKVCHGCNVFQEAIKQILKFNSHLKYSNFFSINFLKHFSYFEKIIIKKKRNYFFLFQKKFNSAEIQISKFKEKNLLKNFEKKNYRYFSFNKKKEHNNKLKELTYLLGRVSKHTGMVYPGKNSIISSISIKINKFKTEIKNGIYSKLVKKGFPLIDNYLIFNKFIIKFETLHRPSFQRKKIQPSFILKKLVKKINFNILILGASGSLGYEMLNLYKMNKNIKIFGTYNKKKIKFIDKNVKIFKANIEKDIKKIINVIITEKIGAIYYFPSYKIFLKSSKQQNEKYKKIFLEFPIQIIRELKNYNKKIRFYYPSTTFIEGKNKNTDYSLIKKTAEKKLKNICKTHRFIKLKISRLPQLHSKQNLNIFGVKYPSLIEILNNNNKLIKNLV